MEDIFKRLFGRKETTSLFSRLLKIIVVFSLVSFAWILFRSNTIEDAVLAISKIFTKPGSPYVAPMAMLFGCLSILIMFIKDFADEFHPKWKLFNSDNEVVSIISTALLLVYIVLFGVLDSSQFIYFQF